MVRWISSCNVSLATRVKPSNQELDLYFLPRVNPTNNDSIFHYNNILCILMSYPSFLNATKTDIKDSFSLFPIISCSLFSCSPRSSCPSDIIIPKDKEEEDRNLISLLLYKRWKDSSFLHLIFLPINHSTISTRWRLLLSIHGEIIDMK